MSVSKPPSLEYLDRQQAREKTAAALEAIHIRLGNLRFLLVLIATGIAWFSLHKHVLSSLWLILPVVLFVVTASYHATILRRQAMALRAAHLYKQGIARIEDRWPGTNPREPRSTNTETLYTKSLYAEDLDLFGNASLFELLCTTRTRIGEDVLAGWLLAPATLTQIKQRQAAVRELRDRLDLREDIASLGKDANSIALHPEPLLRWAATASHPASLQLRLVVAFLALCAIVAAVFWFSTGPLYPLGIVLLVEWCLYFSMRKRVQQAINGTEHALEGLQLFSAVLARIEAEPFNDPMLRSLQTELITEDITASKAIAALARLVQRIDGLHNPLLHFLDVPLLLSVQLSFAVRSWRAAHAKSVGCWLRALGEMEALLAIATFHYEHPDDPFPEFLVPEEQQRAPCFHAEALGHPLLPAAKCVRNDVHLCESTKLLLISGSNMSGKSTLLRSIGINIVLAMCGAPVRARSLHLTPLHVAASILVNDSLHEGSSRFYAEITRLRAICDLAEKHASVIFLLDELLQGTNSKDRLTGASGIAHALIASGAVGVITTHDLSLTQIEESGDLGLRNMHLEDRIEGGKMHFDFTLRDGIVTKSNGVELMRLVGLKV